MLKKTLMIAAAAVAISTGASALHAPAANAGGKFNITIGGGYYGGGYYGGYYGGCHWKKRKVRIKYWNGWTYKYKWVWRRYKVCW